MNKLTNDQIFEHNEKLKSKGAHIHCPMCKSTSFNVVGKNAIINFPDITDKGEVQIIPVSHRKYILQTCINCGYTLLFDNN